MYSIARVAGSVVRASDQYLEGNRRLRTNRTKSYFWVNLVLSLGFYDNGCTTFWPYTHSERSRSAQSTTAKKEDREIQLRQEKDQQIQDLQQLLQVSDGHIQQKDAVIASKQREIQRLTQEIQQLGQEHKQVIRGKDYNIEARERQFQELKQQLAASEQVIAQLQQNLQQRAKIIQELQEENQCLHATRVTEKKKHITTENKHKLEDV